MNSRRAYPILIVAVVVIILVVLGALDLVGALRGIRAGNPCLGGTC